MYCVIKHIFAYEINIKKHGNKQISFNTLQNH